MIAFDDCTSIKYPNRVFIPLEENHMDPIILIQGMEF